MVVLSMLKLYFATVPVFCTSWKADFCNLVSIT